MKKISRTKIKKLKRNLTRGVTKKNHTLSLNHEQFEQLQRYCFEHQLTVSQVVDALIEAFLKD